MLKNIFFKSSVLLLSFSSFGFSGCAPALFALSTVGSGIKQAAHYVSTNKVAKTFNFDILHMKKSLMVSLSKMGISVENTSEIEQGEEIFASASNMRISIELKELTPTLTRMEILAKSSLVVMDKATAEEIIVQSARTAEKLYVANVAGEKVASLLPINKLSVNPPLLP